MKQILPLAPARARAFAAAALVFLLSFAVFAPPQKASADLIAIPKYFSNWQNDLCFEVDGTTNGSLVRAANCVPSKASQRFYLELTSAARTYRIHSYQVPGKCLDIQGASTANGEAARLILYTCVSSAYEQEFEMTEFSPSLRYQWRPTHISGHTKCLGATSPDHGARIVQEPCNSGVTDHNWFPYTAN